MATEQVIEVHRSGPGGTEVRSLMPHAEAA